MPSGRTFNCEGRQSILEAALSASLALDYGCSSGTCGLCLGRLLQGEIEKVSHHDFVVRDAACQRGEFLLCAYTAASPEVVIEAPEASGSADIPWQKINARARRLDPFTDEIAALRVQTPRTSRLRFLPGQNVRLTLEDGASADLPIASCPCDDRNIEFHLRRDPHSAFHLAVFGGTRSPAPVLIEGPWGPSPDDASAGTTLCLAYDVHIAPLRSWIEQQLSDDAARSIRVCWYARTEADFYLTRLFQTWHDAFDAFTFETILSPRWGDLTEHLENSVAPALVSAGRDNRCLVSGPDAFTDQVTGLLDGVDVPLSRRYVHSARRP